MDEERMVVRQNLKEAMKVNQVVVEQILRAQVREVYMEKNRNTSLISFYSIPEKI
jgi:hypothetical protein